MAAVLPLGAVTTRTPSLVRAELTFSAFTPEREYRVSIHKQFGMLIRLGLVAVLPLGAVTTRTPSLVRAELTFSAFTPERESRVGIRKQFWYAEKTKVGGCVAPGSSDHQYPLLSKGTSLLHLSTIRFLFQKFPY